MEIRHVVFPIDWPERPSDGPGRSLGGHDGHGIVRLSMQPPIRKPFWQSWAATLAKLARESDAMSGKEVLVRIGRNGVGPYRLRVGRHPEYGLVAACLVAGELTLFATYEMGSLELATADMQAFVRACQAMVIEVEQVGVASS